MSNHTPGPYRKSPPLDRPRLIAGVEIGSDHGIVAYVYGTTDAECVANAYLLEERWRWNGSTQNMRVQPRNITFQETVELVEQLRTAERDQ